MSIYVQLESALYELYEPKVTRDNCLPSRYRQYTQERKVGIDKIINDYQVECAHEFANIVKRLTGINRLNVWEKNGMVRVYFPGKIGYVVVGQDGTINSTSRGRLTLNTSGMYKSWRVGLNKAFKEYLGRHSVLIDKKEAKIDGLLKELDKKYKKWTE